MKTITCGGNRVAVKQVAQIGGYIDETTEGDEILYRDRKGRYYLEVARAKAVSPNAHYTMPRDKEWFDAQRQRTVTVKFVSELSAMLWFIAEFTPDPKFAAAMCKRVIGEGPAKAEVIPFPIELQKAA